MHRLLILDNKTSVGQREVHNNNDFHFDGIRFRFGTIISSKVKSILTENGIMTVKTRNSTYTFKEV